jgi:hypothetical protein
MKFDEELNKFDEELKKRKQFKFLVDFNAISFFNLNNSLQVNLNNGIEKEQKTTVIQLSNKDKDNNSLYD